MGSVYKRGQVLWMNYKEVDGERVQKPTPYRIDGPDPDKSWKLAEALLREIEKSIKEGIPANNGPMTFRQWAVRWAKGRENGRIELAQFENHAPGLLAMRLDQIKPRDIIAWIEDQKRSGAAPRSIWNRHSHLKKCLGDAVVAEVIPCTPCLVPRGTLPPRIDQDPTWRDAAVFDLDEVIQLMSDERIDLRYRVVYALKGLTGARHGEIQGLTWENVKEGKPLPKIVYAYQYDRQRTKTGATKIVPIHPALGAILAAWRQVWPSLYGREPEPGDRVVGLIPDGIWEHSSVANPVLHQHLALLGLRIRDGHDLRGSFVSNAVDRGAVEYVVKSITHPKPVVREAFEAYLRRNYDKQCKAVLVLDVPIPPWAQRVLDQAAPGVVKPVVVEASSTIDVMTADDAAPAEAAPAVVGLLAAPAPGGADVGAEAIEAPAATLSLIAGEGARYTAATNGRKSRKSMVSRRKTVFGSLLSDGTPRNRTSGASGTAVAGGGCGIGVVRFRVLASESEFRSSVPESELRGRRS